MQRLLCAAAAALALTGASAVHAQTTAPYEPVFTPEAYKAHVEFLADDLLEGRGTGQRGHEIAALYVAKQLQGLGLKPAGVDGTWYQPIKFQERSFGAGGASVTVIGPGGERTFANGTDVILYPNALKTAETLEAPLVFVGFGLDAPEYGRDDYKGLDVRGKIVVALQGAPRGMPSEIGAHLNTQKYKMAEKHGAVGLITVRTLATEKLRAWDKYQATASVPRMTWLDAAGKPHVEAPTVRQVGLFNTPAAELLFAGAPRSLAKVRAEADRNGGAPKGFALKTRVKLDVESVHRTIESPNVVGLLPGGDLKDEYVIVMGHLDHLGVRPELEGDNIFNGAMDNATGIAAILETARALAKAPTPPRRSVLFLAVTAEEKGLLGAEYFSENPLVPLDRVAGVVNMDMPILTYDFGDVVAFGADSSTLGRLAQAAADKVGVKLSPDPSPAEGFFTRSDHYTLVKKGVPALYLDTGPKDASGGDRGEIASTEFLTHHYHEASDQVDLPFDWNAGAKFSRMNWNLVSAIANADEPGRWYEGDFFGKTFAPDTPKARK